MDHRSPRRIKFEPIVKQITFLPADRPMSMLDRECRHAPVTTKLKFGNREKRARRKTPLRRALPSAMHPYSLLSIFQKTGVAGPSITPVSDFRQAVGMRYCPSGT